MTEPTSEVIAALARDFEAGRVSTEPRQRRASELRIAAGLGLFVENLEQTFTPPGEESRWRRLRAAVRECEREIRGRELLAPADEESFRANLLWAIQRGGEKELAILRTIRPSPPYSSPDALKLLEVAEQRIRERLRPVPLPDLVRRMANAYTMSRLGDALQPEHTGTLSAEGEARTWHVRVLRRATGDLRGVLSIREGSLAVQWAPEGED